MLIKSIFIFRKFIVARKLVDERLLHLQKLDQNKQRRKAEIRQMKSDSQAKSYKDIDWEKHMVDDTLKVLLVFSL